MSPATTCWSLSHQSLLKKMFYSQILWRNFLNWYSLLSDNSGLCQVNTKLASIAIGLCRSFLTIHSLLSLSPNPSSHLKTNQSSINESQTMFLPCHIELSSPREQNPTAMRHWRLSGSIRPPDFPPPLHNGIYQMSCHTLTHTMPSFRNVLLRVRCSMQQQQLLEGSLGLHIIYWVGICTSAVPAGDSFSGAHG